MRMEKGIVEFDKMIINFKIDEFSQMLDKINSQEKNLLMILMDLIILESF